MLEFLLDNCILRYVKFNVDDDYNGAYTCDCCEFVVKTLPAVKPATMPADKPAVGKVTQQANVAVVKGQQLKSASVKMSQQSKPAVITVANRGGKGQPAAAAGDLDDDSDEDEDDDDDDDTEDSDEDDDDDSLDDDDSVDDDDDD